MRDVPKFVLKRLEESAGGEAHPDADLLTGFVEKSLLESERKQVMEHLARCSACRETVALTLPAFEDVASEDVAPIPSVRPTRNRWFSWAAVGWAAATVAIVAITFVGIREYRLRTNDTSSQVLMSKNETAPPPNLAAPPPKALSDSDSLKSAPQEKNGEGANSPRMTQPNRQEHFSIAPLNRLSNQPPSPHAGQVHGAAGRAASVASGAAGARSAAAPEPGQSSEQGSKQGSDRGSKAGKETAVPPASETVEVEVETEDAVVPASPGRKVSGQSVNKKEAVDEQSTKNFADGAAPPQWSISSEGALQRSLDAGQTWVNVNPEQEVQQSTATARTEIARALKRSAQKKSDARSTPVFRAVAAFGNEVWAGGSAAALYHSGDSGVHWARIVPFARGVMLTGDISSINFSDPQNGTITTSTGEVWITADGGRTWRR